MNYKIVLNNDAVIFLNVYPCIPVRLINVKKKKISAAELEWNKRNAAEVK